MALLITGAVRKSVNNDTSGPSREPLPTAWYDAQIVNASLKTASTGNQMIEWILEVVTGDHAGRKLWENTVLTENAAWSVRRMLVAAGVPIPPGDAPLDAEEAIGRQIRILVGPDKDKNGLPRNKINDIQPPVAGQHPAGGAGGGNGKASLRAVQEEPAF